MVDGSREGLEAELDEALAAGARAALDIVNGPLMAGMKTVGELFGSGRMQLPFVLQSAEVMKAPSRTSNRTCRRRADRGRGKVVLATVKGDVHDIGKNLVDIILTNNGYEVHNLGTKVAISEMVTKADEVGADVIGMSGLLVKSTLIMRDNLLELNERGLDALPRHPGRGRPHAHVRRKGPARRSTRGGCSTGRTHSRACGPWTS